MKIMLNSGWVTTAKHTSSRIPAWILPVWEFVTGRTYFESYSEDGFIAGYFTRDHHINITELVVKVEPMTVEQVLLAYGRN